MATGVEEAAGQGERQETGRVQPGWMEAGKRLGNGGRQRRLGLGGSSARLDEGGSKPRWRGSSRLGKEAAAKVGGAAGMGRSSSQGEGEQGGRGG